MLELREIVVFLLNMNGKNNYENPIKAFTETSEMKKAISSGPLSCFVQVNDFSDSNNLKMVSYSCY